MLVHVKAVKLNRCRKGCCWLMLFNFQSEQRLHGKREENLNEKAIVYVTLRTILLNFIDKFKMNSKALDL